MKENNELEKADIAIDREMEVDCDIGQEITVYIETWFDVDKKFGVQTADDDSTWLNMYGKYNPSKIRFASNAKSAAITAANILTTSPPTARRSSSRK